MSEELTETPENSLAALLLELELLLDQAVGGAEIDLDPVISAFEMYDCPGFVQRLQRIRNDELEYGFDVSFRWQAVLTSRAQLGREMFKKLDGYGLTQRKTGRQQNIILELVWMIDVLNELRNSVDNEDLQRHLGLEDFGLTSAVPEHVYNKLQRILLTRDVCVGYSKKDFYEVTPYYTVVVRAQDDGYEVKIFDAEFHMDDEMEPKPVFIFDVHPGKRIFLGELVNLERTIAQYGDLPIPGGIYPDEARFSIARLVLRALNGLSEVEDGIRRIVEKEGIDIEKNEIDA